MKLFVHHDATGAIRSIVTVNAPTQFHAMLTPKAGLLVAEVDSTEIKSGASVEELRKIAKDRMVVTPNRVKLTKKSSS
jgi:hypothetical protein